MARTITARVPLNGAERAFYDWAQSKGWTMTKRGWPDFFCFGPEGLMLVEVKPKRGRRVSPWQAIVMEKLIAAGLPCFRWDPQTGELTEPHKLKGYTIKEVETNRYTLDIKTGRIRRVVNG